MPGRIASRTLHVPQKPQIINTTYTSDPVTIPSSFLLSPQPPSHPAPTITRIDFAKTALPEYSDCKAFILDDVLSATECRALLSLAEESASSSGVWRPAMVNAGPNQEILVTDYRNSDRIIWDSKEMVDRIWGRCLRAEGLWESLSVVEGDEGVLGKRPVQRGERWVFTRLNERMRFLRYGPGQFFQTHCDGSYVNPDPKITERSLLTLQLYLNTDDSELVGGATSFHAAGRGLGQLDVVPKPGRVLLFQQRALVHSGQEVSAGVKYTMRTDLMYELVPKA